MTMVALFDCDSDENGDTEAVASQIPMSQFPPLPRPASGYRSEPCMGICIVLVLSALLVSVTQGIAETGEAASEELSTIMKTLIWSEAGIAIACMLFILNAEAGVIPRSKSTCYPIPDEVEERLKTSRSLEGLKNIPGPQGDTRRGSYCVRCLVWRPGKEDSGKVHHCNVCQRCVKGFDHHCGVFGRCIVRGNLPCFYTLIGMMFAGMGTAMVAVTASGTTESGGGMRLL